MRIPSSNRNNIVDNPHNLSPEELEAQEAMKEAFQSIKAELSTPEAKAEMFEAVTNYLTSDKHAVKREDGSVDHAASALNNLKQVGIDFKNIVDLDHFKWVIDNAGSDITAHLLMWSMFMGIGVIGIGTYELCDVVLNPLVKAPTNLAHSVIHGVKALFTQD